MKVTANMLASVCTGSAAGFGLHLDAVVDENSRGACAITALYRVSERCHALNAFFDVLRRMLI